MRPVLTPEQMAAADRRTIDAGTPPGVLVDRAGRAVAWTARRLLGGAYGRRVVVVCGKGNNGGDGRVAAAVLRSWGVRVDAFDLGPAFEPNGLERALARAHLAIDAMFGTGFRGALEGDAARAAEAFARAGRPVLAVDIPSGVDGLTGAVVGPAVRAVRTVCMAGLKTGVVLFPGAEHAGAVEVADIGVDPALAPPPETFVLDGEDVAALLPRRRPETHKWEVGGVLAVAGSAGMLGAANLVTRAALRAGAGMVVLGAPGEEAARRAAGGEVVTLPLPATPEGFLDEPAAKEVLGRLERFRALAIGPGLGTDERTVAGVRRIVAEAPVPVVVDADGLNALAGDLAPVRERREATTVLTPHEGEFARLAGRPPSPDRVAAARELASGTGAVVLLKGSRTVVAHPSGRAVVNTTGGPWLATAGTGDVLTGIVASLLAQGVPAFEAAAAGAWLHGEASQGAGGRGLVAGDLVDALAPTLRALA